MSENREHPADQKAIEKVLVCEPEWQSVVPVGEVVGLEERVLLHAGPAFPRPEAITRPVLNSACVAAMYEGIASSFDAAEAMIRAGDVVLRPAQDFHVVTPLAAVVSSSMAVQVVTDRHDADQRAFAPINGGSGPAMRLGMRNDAVLEHLRWLNGEFCELASKALETPIALLPLAKQGLVAGDDCHGRTPAATAALTAHMVPTFGSGAHAARARQFLEQGPSFFLNLWMAAAKCMLRCAAGTEYSSLVICAGANGAETGIQVAGLAGDWLTAPADPPKGALVNDFPASRALGAIGDSAILDALGFGAMAMVHSPEQRKALRPFMPEGGLELPAKLMLREHASFAPLKLRVGLSARAVCDTNLSPVVSLGILDVEGEEGRLGGGIFEQPMTLFREAVATLGGSE